MKDILVTFKTNSSEIIPEIKELEAALKKVEDVINRINQKSLIINIDTEKPDSKLTIKGEDLIINPSLRPRGE
jgi:hypothetical protein